jgi:prepilin-type N-terminal cleavage/methylation domain-containing protein
VIRRGFTLIELALATMLGTIIVAAALAIFTSMDRADRRFERRFEETVAIERLHNTLRKTFGNIAMSEEAAPPGTPGVQSTSATAGTMQPGRSAEGDTSLTPASLPPPRFVLLEDQNPDVRSMVNLSRALEGGGGSGILAPQIMEVTLTQSPIGDARAAMLAAYETRMAVRLGLEDSGSREADDQESESVPRNESGNDREDLAESAARDRAAALDAPAPADEEDAFAGNLVRGQFFLRPGVADRRRRDEMNPDEIPWDLYWVRLRPRERIEAFDAPLAPPQYVGEPTLVASGLRYFNIRIFKDRGWIRQHAATYFQHLPAYVQVEVETTTGIWAKWLFEVGWVMSAEVPKDANEGPVNAAGQPIDADGAAKDGTTETVLGADGKPVEGRQIESIIKFVETPGSKSGSRSGSTPPKGGGK